MKFAQLTPPIQTDDGYQFTAQSCVKGNDVDVILTMQGPPAADGKRPHRLYKVSLNLVKVFSSDPEPPSGRLSNHTPADPST